MLRKGKKSSLWSKQFTYTFTNRLLINTLQAVLGAKGSGHGAPVLVEETKRLAVMELLF